MIPAWDRCPSGWTVEYTGYLMSTRYTQTKATFECVDMNAESIPGSHANTNGGMDYHVRHMILRRSSPVLCALSDTPEH